MDVIDIEFEFFDPDTTIDFHGLKTLLRQLLDIDAQLQDISALADLLLSQGDCVGNTVKVDGIETDPYAFLSVLNLHQHRDNAAVSELTKYLKDRASVSVSQGQVEGKSIVDILNGMGETKQVGLIISERLINMPHEISPELYRMMLEQIGWAVEDSRPYNFSHYLILTKTYTEIESKLDQEERPKSKKSKGAAGKGETQYFHPEDEIFKKFAVGEVGWEYVKDEGEGAADRKRAFQEKGIRPRGGMVLIERGRMEEAVKAVKEYLNPSS